MPPPLERRLLLWGGERFNTVSKNISKHKPKTLIKPQTELRWEGGEQEDGKNSFPASRICEKWVTFHLLLAVSIITWGVTKSSLFSQNHFSAHIESCFTDRKTYRFSKMRGTHMCRHITCNATKLPQLYKLYSCYCLKVYVSLPCFSFLHLGSSAARWIWRNSVIFHKKNSWKNMLLRLGKICKTISIQDFQLPHRCIFFWLTLVSFGRPWVLGRWKAQVFAVILVCYTALINLCIKYGIDCIFTGDLPSTTFHPYKPSYVHKTFFAQSLNDAYWNRLFSPTSAKYLLFIIKWI